MLNSSTEAIIYHDKGVDCIVIFTRDISTGSWLDNPELKKRIATSQWSTPEGTSVFGMLAKVYDAYKMGSLLYTLITVLRGIGASRTGWWSALALLAVKLITTDANATIKPGTKPSVAVAQAVLNMLRDAPKDALADEAIDKLFTEKPTLVNDTELTGTLLLVGVVAYKHLYPAQTIAPGSAIYSTPTIQAELLVVNDVICGYVVFMRQCTFANLDKFREYVS